MLEEELIGAFPRLYHMAWEGSWPSISKHGLLSTSALLDLFSIDCERRIAIESTLRPERVTICHSQYGVATIRDQKPMSTRGLEKSLQGVDVGGWCHMLNGKVFFWVSEARLNRLLAARAYRDMVHTVLELDTKKLIRVHGERILLSAINSGSTLFNPVARGRGTFLAIEAYPFHHWAKRRRLIDAVVELTVDYSVPCISDYVVSVTERRQGHVLRVLHRA